MRLSAVLLAFVLAFVVAFVLAGPAALVAQQTASPSFGVARMEGSGAQQSAPATKSASSMNLYLPPLARPCSVAAMHATQGSSSQMLRTDDGKSVPMMRPSLTLTPTNGRTIVAATVTAHGTPPVPGTIPLVAHPVPAGEKPQRKELTKTLTIKMKPAGNGTFAAELELPGFSSVTMIDLNSVTYSDGSTWRVTNETGCRVAPDPLLLIAAQ